MLCHLAAFGGLFIPFGNILGPLIVWLVKRYDSPFIDHHGKEALNFQICTTILVFVLLIIFIVMRAIAGFIGIIGIIATLFGFIAMLIALAVFVYSVVVTIIAAIRANEGIEYRYPISIRLIK